MSDGKTRILLVDDRRDHIVSLQATLADLVDELVCLTSGREALRQLLDPQEFALIILDIHMPGMSGFELAEMIRKHRVHQATPIIFMTASTDDLHVERSYALGAVDYVIAPVVATVLRTKVTVLVDLHKKTQQVRRQAEVLRRRATQLHSLTSASLGIHTASSVPAILRAAAEAARDIVGAERVVVCASPAGDVAPPHTVVVRRGGGDDSAVAAQLARLETFVRDRGNVVRLTAQELARSDEWAPGSEGEGRPVGSYVGAPLAWPDASPLGVLHANGKVGGGEFDADDEAVIAQLSHVTSVAIQNRVLGDAREANRLKDEFFSNLSHELRNPLNALTGWVQLLKRSNGEGPGSERAIGALERNAAILTRLVDDLLDVSRIANKRMNIATKPMSLEECVRATVESLRITAEAKGIRVELQAGDGSLDVLGDSQRLTQVVWNLVANALKFTSQGGCVTVSVSRNGNDAVLRVSDDGQGIPAEFLPHVFDRFRQAHPSAQRSTGGLGLGLSIVRAVVELHGGTVRAESAGIGKGASFTVSLPLMIAQPVDLSGYHVLLIERDREQRASMENGFASLGARVTAVSEATEALRALSAQGATKPHVVVAGVDEVEAEALRHLRGMQKGRELPLLALTDGELTDRSLAASFGVHAPRGAAAGTLARAIRSIARAN